MHIDIGAYRDTQDQIGGDMVYFTCAKHKANYIGCCPYCAIELVKERDMLKSRLETIRQLSLSDIKTSY